jgi:diguanylate cyclase (GGDEF)-like protein
MWCSLSGSGSLGRHRRGTFRPGSLRADVPTKRRPSSAKADLVIIGEVAELAGPVDLSDVLSEFARTMLTDFPVQGILDRLVKRIVDVLPVTGAGVTLISADLVPRYVAASNESALRFEELQGELGEGPCLAAYHTGEAISIPDLSAVTWFPAFSPRALDAGLAAVFSFPLHHADLQLGALDLYRDTPGPLSPNSLAAAQTLADVGSAYVISAQARADLQTTSDQARDAGLHDSLTGLPNRALMLQRLEHARRRGRRSRKTSAVFFLDLDRFKMVNDAHGHHVGNEALMAVAERLTAVLRPGDSLARLASDEFVILCEDLDDASQATAMAVRFDAALARPFTLSDVELNLTASIGIAFTRCGADSPEDLLHDADLAMYRTKRRRGRELPAFDLSELYLVEDQDRLEHALPGAADRGELHLEYQPIVAAEDGRLTGVEALLRWEHPGRGPISPAVLVPLAERSGQIVDIGKWVLEQAWSDRHRWQNDNGGDLSVSVNVSAHQLMSAGFADTVAAILDSASTRPGLLTLEVTESVFVRDGERALFVLNDLKDIGVKLALDDFGTGYSSLGYLRRFPVDTVKIDREFVAHLGEDRASHTIVTAVIALAHGLGMTVVSEGVETAAQHRELMALGCDSCQGFYFARPMPASRLDTLIRHQTDAGKSPLLTLAPDGQQQQAADYQALQDRGFGG